MKSFVIYESFRDAIKHLPDIQRLEIIEMIFDYGFDGIEPIKDDPILRLVFNLIKPNIDSAKNRYNACVANGKKGGRPPKEKPKKTKEKPKKNQNNNQTETKTKPNHNLNEDVDVDVDVDVDIKEECEKFSHDSDEMKLSKLLFKKMKINNDKAKEPNIQKWAEHIDKLMRLDKYSAAEITKMIEFCQSDHFWKSNILSTKKLREKAGTLIIQMNRNKEQLQNNKPAQSQNYEQRKYDDDFFDSLYENTQYIK